MTPESSVQPSSQVAGHDQPRPDGDQPPVQTPLGWDELPLLDAAERMGLTTEALREWAEQRRIAHRTVPGRAAVR